jgi:hypothetical protein
MTRSLYDDGCRRIRNFYNWNLPSLTARLGTFFFQRLDATDILQLGDHRAALTTLVRGLRDATSAEAYCTLGGDVVPAKTAQVIGEQYDLQTWASTLFSSPSNTSGKPLPMCRQKTVSEEMKKSLLRILLEVYMEDRYGNS